jgi:hypothetical protein
MTQSNGCNLSSSAANAVCRRSEASALGSGGKKMQIGEWIFYLGHDAQQRGVGTQEQAQQYLKRLNAGRLDRVYVLRKQPGIIDLAAELAGKD